MGSWRPSYGTKIRFTGLIKDVTAYGRDRIGRKEDGVALVVKNGLIVENGVIGGDKAHVLKLRMTKQEKGFYDRIYPS